MAKKKIASSKEAEPSGPPPTDGGFDLMPVMREGWPPYIDGLIGSKTFTDRDGLEIRDVAHLHAMLNEALTERDVALTVKEPGVVVGLNFKFAAEEWGRARDACLKIALDECDSESTAENGQVWANCARLIADRIKELKP